MKPKHYAALHGLDHRVDTSAELFDQSSELGLPHPLIRRRVCLSPLVPGEGAQSLAGEGVASPNSDKVKFVFFLQYLVI